MNVFKKAAGFLGEVRVELGKVAWSNRDELIGATAVVIVVTSLLAAFIGVVDLALSKILSLMFK